MKRLTTIAVLILLCIALPASLEARGKKSVADMSNMNRIFLGWVDIDTNSYRDLGYESREDWAKVIENKNKEFQDDFQSRLSHRHTIVAAKDKGDENSAGNDLYVKFSDASVDHGYKLHLSVHLIDLKTNTEIASIPHLVLNGHLCTLSGCIAKDLKVVSEKLQSMIGPPSKK